MSSDEVRQAPDAIAERKIAAVTAAALIITVIALVVAWVLLERWGQAPRRAESPAAPATIGMLEQTLILHTERGIALRKKSSAELQRWGWADRDAGVAQIPIESAIDVLATTPLPADTPLERRGAER